MRPAFEVADVLRAQRDRIAVSSQLNSWQLRTLDALARCRTASLGGHVDQCTACGTLRISYNSCRNRHCPKCQNIAREQWIDAREADLLPVHYFHVVFTLPDALNMLCMAHPREMYSLLFEVSWNVISTFARDDKHLGAQTGMFAILHTWGQNLSLHPHLHCVVPAGGWTKSGHWKHARSKGTFLFPVKAMSKVYRARFVAALRTLYAEKKWPAPEREFYDALFAKEWVVYAKRPFAGPEQVIEYLGRYTHKIAISNHRLVKVNPDEVSFTWKDYREGAKKNVMTLEAMEFVRRFALHILPKRFVRIRHYGILSSTAKRGKLSAIKEAFGLQHQGKEKKEWKIVSAETLGWTPDRCPCCKQLTMVRVLDFDHRGPPAQVASCLTPKTEPHNGHSKSA
jgi:hypothetical protein